MNSIYIDKRVVHSSKQLRLYLISSLGTVRVWHANTYRLETTLNYGLERLWSISCLRGSNDVAVGYDEGSVIFKVSTRQEFITESIECSMP